MIYDTLMDIPQPIGYVKEQGHNWHKGRRSNVFTAKAWKWKRKLYCLRKIGTFLQSTPLNKLLKDSRSKDAILN
nr:hypothetical protein [Tanacetum cinerariifolium]